LDSDDAIVAIVAHAMHELNILRAILAERETISAKELFREEFVSNLAAGMTPEDAAWSTWIGRQLRKRGFKTVEVAADGAAPEIVTPVFKR